MVDLARRARRGNPLQRPNQDRPASSRWRRRLRILALAFIAVLPWALKRLIYRFGFGYRLHRRSRVGVSILDARSVDLAEGAVIGHFNLVLRVGRFVAAAGTRIGTLNLIRGGDRVHLGSYSTVMRFNTLNAIPDHDCTTDPDSSLLIGDGAFLASGHRVDFTDRVTIGRNAIVGGRNSSLWTHNRQKTAPISIGDFCYLGSEVRLAPGASLPSECILGLGSVLTEQISSSRSLVAGVPARIVRKLGPSDLEHVRRKTRADAPDDLYDDQDRSASGKGKAQ